MLAFLLIDVVCTVTVLKFVLTPSEFTLMDEAWSKAVLAFLLIDVV